MTTDLIAVIDLETTGLSPWRHDRVVEIGRLTDPVYVTGGVAEYFPGVLKAIAEKTGLKVDAVPQPILAGATGAALWVFQKQNISLSQQGAN